MSNKNEYPDDAQLIARCLEQDRQHQEYLYRKYASTLFSVCLMYSDSRQDAQDILQESFIKIFKNLENFRFQGPFPAWLRRVTVNTAINFYRKQQRDRDFSVELDERVEGRSEDEYLLQGLHHEDLVNLVNQLPSKAKMVLKLYAIEGYKHQEIADMMGISEGTSKSQLNRAKHLLKLSIESRSLYEKEQIRQENKG